MENAWAVATAALDYWTEFMFHSITSLESLSTFTSEKRKIIVPSVVKTAQNTSVELFFVLYVVTVKMKPYWLINLQIVKHILYLYISMWYMKNLKIFPLHKMFFKVERGLIIIKKKHSLKNWSLKGYLGKQNKGFLYGTAVYA